MEDGRDGALFLKPSKGNFKRITMALGRGTRMGKRWEERGDQSARVGHIDTKNVTPLGPSCH